MTAIDTKFTGLELANHARLDAAPLAQIAHRRLDRKPSPSPRQSDCPCPQTSASTPEG
jgi:hypothetical protein